MGAFEVSNFIVAGTLRVPSAFIVTGTLRVPSALLPLANPHEMVDSCEDRKVTARGACLLLYSPPTFASLPMIRTLVDKKYGSG